MLPPNQKKLILTSVNQFLILLKQNPELATSLPKFASLLDAPMSSTPKKSCNCGAKQNITTPDANKQTAENILSSLTDEEFKKIKSVLNLDELCYYKREDNRLALVCV